MTHPIRVLFLCTGNSARSIIAEALLKNLGGAKFDVQSAGTQPKGINPNTKMVLEEAQVDITGAESKSLDEFVGEHFDYVITVCDAAAEQCPVFPGEPRRIHWSLPDPAAINGSDEEKLAAFRRTLKEMTIRLTTFIPTAERASEKSR